MELLKVNISAEDSSFWNALKIYYESPKCLNKEILFSEKVLCAQLRTSFTLEDCTELVDRLSCKLLKDGVKTIVRQEFSTLKDVDVNDVFSHPDRIYLVISKLIPKLNINENLKFYQFIFLNKPTSTVYVFKRIISNHINEIPVTLEKQDPLAILKFNFIQLNWCRSYFEIFYNRDLSDKGITWLKATFAPKFCKLVSNSSASSTNNKKKDKLCFSSRVDIVQYYKLYEEMKLKYGKYFIEHWTEKTDPKKFVYEDIGIATYLMMLWNNGKIPEENSKKQKFIDLGCGNGLLVHILNSEGHMGIGLDIRKRKIWDFYPPTTVLEEKTIVPTIETTYPGFDWLIGNHSDELTAWIPIMARLSSSNCQYFVLPCCPYELNGMKFQRKNTSLSSYQDFINYVNKISILCGFDTYIDKLRIPSTKRICLVGVTNLISNDEYLPLKKSILEFVQDELVGNGVDKSVVGNIKLRTPVEPVRNCTKLPLDFIDYILKNIMNELLKENVIYTVTKNGKYCTWNRGRKLPIRDLVSSLEKEQMNMLKNECKGLQTLLKNHHLLFDVNQGCVQFRSPENILELCKKFLNSQTSAKWKVKQCWFYKNHPDKCPLNDEVCSFRHDV